MTDPAQDRLTRWVAILVAAAIVLAVVVLLGAVVYRVVLWAAS